MKKYLLIAFAVLASLSASAQINTSRLGIGVGLMYHNSLDATLSFEIEGKHHNMWEFFANGCLKWKTCDICGHVCPDSFWKNYRTYGFGAAYKPCVTRGRNNHGNLRIGASIGSDLDDVLGGFHAGYEHNFVLRSGCIFFWQAKVDLMVVGQDLFRTGIVLGIKFPLKKAK